MHEGQEAHLPSWVKLLVRLARPASAGLVRGAGPSRGEGLCPAPTPCMGLTRCKLKLLKLLLLVRLRQGQAVV